MHQAFNLHLNILLHIHSGELEETCSDHPGILIEGLLSRTRVCLYITPVFVPLTVHAYVHAS